MMTGPTIWLLIGTRLYPYHCPIDIWEVLEPNKLDGLGHIQIVSIETNIRTPGVEQGTGRRSIDLYAWISVRKMQNPREHLPSVVLPH